MKKKLSSMVVFLIAMCLHAQHNYDNQSTIYSLNGKVGVGVTNPATKLHVNGDIRGNRAGGALRINGTFGYIDVGPLNSSWAHIYTNMPKFIFNKDVYTITNAFSSYNNDLILKTKGTERIRVKDENGFVGIGTTNILSKLHLNALERTAFRIYREGRTDKYLSIWHGTGGAVIEPIRTDNSTGVLYLGGYDTPTNTFFARSGGTVGIGTTNTRGYKLAVNGKIRAKEIVVEAAPWPDYVFKKEYNLPTLSEVAKHIKNKGHLPNIPSENEVSKNGISLGEINVKLLEKIEELTLYTIQQEEKIETLKKLLQSVQKEVDLLKADK